jgi:hypothetical protein
VVLAFSLKFTIVVVVTTVTTSALDPLNVVHDNPCFTQLLYCLVKYLVKQVTNNRLPTARGGDACGVTQKINIEQQLLQQRLTVQNDARAHLHIPVAVCEQLVL